MSFLETVLFVKRGEAGRHVDIEPLVYRVTRQTTGLSIVKRVQRHSECRRYRLCLEVPPRDGRRMSVVQTTFENRPPRKRNLEKEKRREEEEVTNNLIFGNVFIHNILDIRVTITSPPRRFQPYLLRISDCNPREKRRMHAIKGYALIGYHRFLYPPLSL